MPFGVNVMRRLVLSQAVQDPKLALFLAEYWQDSNM